MYKYSKNVDVLFFIEHKDRELDIILEIANTLEIKYKLKIAIASLIYEPMSSLFQVNPKVIVTPSTAFGKGSVAWIYNSIYGENIIYVNMNYEQFISSWKGNYKVPTHIVSKKYQKHFVWGEYFKKTLSEQDIPNENIYVTGRPLSTIIKKIYKNKKEQHRKEISKKLNLDINKKWLFIALTDGLAFVSSEKIEFIISNGANAEGLKRHVKHVKKTIKYILKWIEKLSKEDDGHYIILRPHPSIAKEQYEELFLREVGYIPKNVYISKSFNAYKWLEASDKYFTNYSTLAIDAYILEKEYYIFSPIEKLLDENYWWCENGIQIKNYEEFLNIYKNNKNYNKEKEDMKMNNYYIDFDLDGIEKSSEFLYGFVKQIENYPNKNLINKFKPFIFSFKRTVGSLIRLFLIKNEMIDNPFIRKGTIVDYFTYEEIAKIKKGEQI